MLKKVYSLVAPNKIKHNLIIYPDDTFLVSYPKSGNTWVRFILANLMKADDEVIDFHSAIRYVPEIGTHNDILINTPRPRIIKSHSMYDKTYPKVIYLVRDPRDTYVSYYYYLKKSLPVDISFSEFLRKPDMHPSRWHSHVESWLDKPNISLVIKYEDLLLNTHQEVCKIANLLFKKQLSEEKIKLAIQASSFEGMKKIEQEKGRPFKTEDAAAKATTFVRKGGKGDWANYFSREDEEFLKAEAEHILRCLNYV